MNDFDVDSAARDQERVDALDRYGALADDFRRADDLQALVELAADTAGTPLATINLIDDTYQHQVATAGFAGVRDLRRDSMCELVLDQLEPVVVPDVTRDERFNHRVWPFGDDQVRFYASFHLRTPAKVTIGTLCVFDTAPRTIDAEEHARLVRLSERVVGILEMEQRNRELDQSVRHLRQGHEQLRLTNENLAAFAGQVTHDLRTPLASLAMSLGLLEEVLDEGAGVDRDQVAFLAARASAATQRMSELVDAVFGYSTGATGDLTGRVDLARIMDHVREDLASLLVDAELHIGELPVVPGDVVRLRQVLQNLVSNAIKFVAPGTLPVVHVSAQPHGDLWRIEVRDNGIGIAEESLPHIFEPFARGYESAPYPGSGVGLATCRSIVQAHGGQIGIGRPAEGGTVVWLDLPAASPSR